ncbi:MAG TPA: helix-turn-helix domain-containing protein [Azospirillaceae bacterium]|nr:helix-turn-helix domain-containing protein [Azospirillaceae bacterium]
MRRARSPAGWGSDGHDRRRLRRVLAETSDLRLFRRAQAVLLVARGGSCRAAAELAGATERAVGLWVGRYLRRRRAEDLADAPRSGRPPAAAGLTDELLAREFEKDPQSLGYRATAWTVPLLAGHLGRRCGCPVTRRTLRRRMRAAGLAWKRPRHVFGDKARHLPQKKGRLSAA